MVKQRAHKNNTHIKKSIILTRSVCERVGGRGILMTHISCWLIALNAALN